MFVRPVGGFTAQCQTCHGAVLFGIGMVVALHNSADSNAKYDCRAAANGSLWVISTHSGCDESYEYMYVNTHGS